MSYYTENIWKYAVNMQLNLQWILVLGCGLLNFVECTDMLIFVLGCGLLNFVEWTDMLVLKNVGENWRLLAGNMTKPDMLLPETKSITLLLSCGCDLDNIAHIFVVLEWSRVGFTGSSYAERMCALFAPHNVALSTDIFDAYHI